MGLFSFNNRKQERKQTESSAPVREKYFGDLEKSEILSQLFGISVDKRDEDWKPTFFANVADASFACGEPQIVTGPDGFPYFQLNSPIPNQAFQCYVIRHIIKDFILDRGIGVAINVHKGQPDWIFTYGDLVNFYLREEFYTSVPPLNLPEIEVIKGEEKILTGQPSENVLPLQTRAVIRQFLEQQGIEDTKVALISRKYEDTILQELVINLTPNKIGMDRFETLTSHLAWFLPRHYSVIAMDDDGTLKEAFRTL